MASSISAYFFKAENSNLTVEEIRSKGYLARLADNGFIEAAPWYKLQYVLNDKFTESKHKKYVNDFTMFLINSLKENTPPLMKLESSSFGGCMDEVPFIVAYEINEQGRIIQSKHYDKADYFDFDDEDEDFDTTNETEELKPEENACETLFEKHYGTIKYFSTVGFFRDTSDISSDEQDDMLKVFEKEIEAHDYNNWLDGIKSKKPEDLLKLYIESEDFISKNNSRYSYGKDEELFAARRNKDNIRYLIGMKE